MQSAEFQTATPIELESKIEFLDTEYAGFAEEYKRYVHWIDAAEFKEQDQYFAKVEKWYQEIKIIVRS